MLRLAVITVGKTNSGKTTFTRALENELGNYFMMDQDNNAEFLPSNTKITEWRGWLNGEKSLGSSRCE